MDDKKKKKRTRHQNAHYCLLFWCLFIGIGAVWGSSCMLIKPDGSLLHMNEILPYFQVLPFSEYLFQDFIFSGFALLIVNGLSNLTAAYFMIKKNKLGETLGMIFGIILMLWICIQFVIFPTNVLSTVYFFFGLAQFGTGFACYVFDKQDQYKESITQIFNETEVHYKDINPESKTLVLYFSRMGYVKKQAYEIANQEKAAICEVKAKERTEGTLGFWWCGRFGMHAWPMKIEPLEVNPTDYDKIVICTPVWVFKVAGPIRQLCLDLSGKVENVNYVLVHFEKSRFASAVAEMDRMLGVTHKSARTICNKRGKIIFDKQI